MDAETPTTKIQKFFANYRLIELETSEVIAKPGEAIRYVYFIEQGQVKEYDIASNGSEIVVNVLKPGAFFSVTQAISGGNYSWFYETIKKSKLRIASVDEVIEFIKSDPEVMYNLLSRISRGASGMQRRMAHLMGGTAHSRVLFELVAEFSRFGTPTKDGKLKLDTTEADLATKSGLSREAVSKEVRKLAKDGQIETAYRKITTNSLEQLKANLAQSL